MLTKLVAECGWHRLAPVAHAASTYHLIVLDNSTYLSQTETEWIALVCSYTIGPVNNTPPNLTHLFYRLVHSLCTRYGVHTVNSTYLRAVSPSRIPVGEREPGC